MHATFQCLVACAAQQHKLPRTCWHMHGGSTPCTLPQLLRGLGGHRCVHNTTVVQLMQSEEMHVAKHACTCAAQSMKAVEVPIYDFTTHQRSSAVRRVEPADVVIIEGILVLHMPDIRDMLNMKIFVDTDDDLRLARRCAPDQPQAVTVALFHSLQRACFCHTCDL